MLQKILKHGKHHYLLLIADLSGMHKVLSMLYLQKSPLLLSPLFGLLLLRIG